jgi:excisionase family DNA binding protein
MTTDTYSTIELLTIAQVADFLKLSVPSVRRLQQRRAIPFFKVGGSVRFAKNDIVAYLEKHRVMSIGR